MKKKILYIFITTFVLLGFISVLIFNKVTPKSLDEKALYAATLGGDYLVRNQNDIGSFIYDYDPAKDKDIKGYNMLRHSGTTYAIFELYQSTHKKKYLETGEKAIDFLLTTIGPCPGQRSHLSCAYDGQKTKLGGNALAILAMVQHAEVTNSDKYIEEAISLASWMKEVQTDEGEFSVHIQLKDGRIDDHVSQYYPGEAIYSLMKLYKATNEKTWLAVAERAALWLIEVRDKNETSDTIIHDHWLLYGLRELYLETHSEVYLTHAKKIVDGIVVSQHSEGVEESWVGGYYNPPRSTPTATRSEGLGAAYELFVEAGEEEYLNKAFESLEKGIEFQLRTFIDGPTARTYPNPVKALGGFRYSLTEDDVRIDYVQHNISAMLLYYSFSK